tara:strand:- start:3086 stop:3319 length:234 start_codon:yes stop_codon:yes gene_type:complete
MQLYEFLAAAEVSQTTFADRIGVSQPTLSRYLTGKTLPSVVIGARIEKVTLGKVPCSAWETFDKDHAEALARLVEGA